MLGGWPAGDIWLSAEPADLRRSFDGLCALVATHLGENRGSMPSIHVARPLLAGYGDLPNAGGAA